MLCRKIIFTFCGLIPACMVMAQISSLKATSIADKIVAVVGDRIILSSDIQNSINSLVRQNAPVPANVACLVTEQAIVSKLLMLQALKDSLPVTDEEVESELDQRIRYYINQLGSKEKLEEYAGKSVYQIKDDARESVREKKLAEAMRQKIISNIPISPVEVKIFFDKIPKDSLPLLEPEMEVGQIVFYPVASKDLEQYVVNELNNYRDKVENRKIPFCSIRDNNTCNEQEINRNNKELDPAFVSAAFHLKDGEISAPVNGKFGFYLIQMTERKGDNATVRYVFRPHPVTDVEISQAKSELNALRSDIMDGKIGFNEAASNYSQESNVKFYSPFFLNRDGSYQVTIDQLEKDVADIINRMTVGEISRPMLFVDDQNKKGVRLIYLKSRSEPHRMNLRDDYSKISRMALEEKQGRVLDKWLKVKIPAYYIMVDNETAADCPGVKKYASTDSKGF